MAFLIKARARKVSAVGNVSISYANHSQPWLSGKKHLVATVGAGDSGSYHLKMDLDEAERMMIRTARHLYAYGGRDLIDIIKRITNEIVNDPHIEDDRRLERYHEQQKQR